MGSNPQVEEKVVGVLKSLFRAYAHRDINETMAIFAPSSDIVLVGTRGDHRVGVEGVKTYFEEEFAALSRIDNYRWKTTWLSVGSTGPVAWTVMEVTGEFVKGGQAVRIPHRLTTLMRQRHESWYIVQAHFSCVAGERHFEDALAAPEIGDSAPARRSEPAVPRVEPSSPPPASEPAPPVAPRVEPPRPAEANPRLTPDPHAPVELTNSTDAPTPEETPSQRADWEDWLSRSATSRAGKTTDSPSESDIDDRPASLTDLMRQDSSANEVVSGMGSDSDPSGDGDKGDGEDNPKKELSWEDWLDRSSP
ncbi:hypothetical protein Pan216_53450 [Planctomycetes bacterium Pan216]|uniref:SnoaL-like domain-containing protein n=1 Tax=Kolteria novifilia TaxID=2527975 RepID=A0A518BBU7_9BACT|nr:hypothetical protein Pan216_53450 [Planctomycetes bacterium Pan216]